VLILVEAGRHGFELFAVPLEGRLEFVRGVDTLDVRLERKTDGAVEDTLGERLSRQPVGVALPGGAGVLDGEQPAADLRPLRRFGVEGIGDLQVVVEVLAAPGGLARDQRRHAGLVEQFGVVGLHLQPLLSHLVRAIVAAIRPRRLESGLHILERRVEREEQLVAQFLGGRAFLIDGVKVVLIQGGEGFGCFLLRAQHLRFPVEDLESLRSDGIGWQGLAQEGFGVEHALQSIVQILAHPVLIGVIEIPFDGALLAGLEFGAAGLAVGGGAPRVLGPGLHGILAQGGVGWLAVRGETVFAVGAGKSPSSLRCAAAPRWSCRLSCSA
jgi:hypothetical protein